jgi:transcriptional regulator NrdR family protein
MTDPDTCQHHDTTVYSSRPDGALRADGYRHHAQRSYPCLVFRNRKCLDCGHKFSTVEVPRGYMDDLVEANDPAAMRKQLAKEVFAYLTKGLEA